MSHLQLFVSTWDTYVELWKQKPHRSSCEFEVPWIRASAKRLTKCNTYIHRTSFKMAARTVRWEGSSSSGGVGVPSPRSWRMKLIGCGSRHRASAAGTADRARGRWRVIVILPTEDSVLGSARAINSLSSGPVGSFGFGLGHPVEVDIIAGKGTFGRLGFGLLGEVELQVNGHLKM